MKTIYVNDLDLNSIKKAEKQKFKLENDGYNLIETRQTGFNKWLMFYKKEAKQCQ